jgi:hypothetical protein
MSTRPPTKETERLLRNACSLVERLVQQGQVEAANTVLKENPNLAIDSECAIEIIYAESTSRTQSLAGSLPFS